MTAPLAFEWSGRPDTGAVPGVVRMPVLYGHADDLAPQAAPLAAALRALPPGQRWLMCDGWLAHRALKGRDYVDLYAGRVDLRAEADRLRPVADALRAAGATPDAVVMDQEDGHDPQAWIWTGTTAERAAAVGRLYADPEALARLPLHLRHRRPGDYDPWDWEPGGGRYAVAQLSRHASAQRAAYLREILHLAGLPVAERKVVVNYGDLTLDAPMLDIHSWECGRATVTGDAAPPTYAPVGHFAWTMGRRLNVHARWIAFILRHNTVRGCLRGAGPGSVVPWVGPEFWGPESMTDRRQFYPGLDAGWADGLRHDIAAGVNAVLLWNPRREEWGAGAGEADPDGLCDAGRTAAMVGKVLAEFPERPRRKSLPPVAYEAREVVTPVGDGREVVTRYEDFVAAMGEAGT